jgi:hypothetical protein
LATYFHYTKGYRVGQIFIGQGLVPIEHEQVMPGDPFVWLTRSAEYPVTALPRIADVLDTDLSRQLRFRRAVDMLEVAKHVGGIWRFAFDTADHPEIKPWFGSYQRSKFVKTPWGKVLERTARKVGDRVELWGISPNQLSIGDSMLQQLTPQGWVDRVEFMGQGDDIEVADIGAARMSKIATDSIGLFMRLKREQEESGCEVSDHDPVSSDTLNLQEKTNY